MDDRNYETEHHETRGLPAPHEQLLLPAETDGPKSHRTLWLFLLGFGILFVVVVLAGLLPRIFRDRETARRADQEKNAKPMLEVATVQRSKGGAGLVVPGTMIPLTEAYVYARANGYLKSRYVDIGDHVAKGQLLAVIDAPDIDAQVAQARQQLLQAGQQLDQQKAQLILATATVQRYRVLVAKGVFSRQDGDQQEANYASQAANVAAAQRNVEAYRANLQRNLALQSYEQVRAPFTGVVTQRNVDIGALISASGASSSAMPSPTPQGQTSSAGGSQQASASNNAGSSGSTNTSATSAQAPGQGGPLFGVAQVERLRILVSVPEGYASDIHVGEAAPVAVQEYAGAALTAQVTRTAGSIDANTRTMLTELQIDNRAGKLISGMYAVVTFPGVAASGDGSGPVLITGDAIVIRKDKPTVAVVVDGKVRLIPVTIGRDFGTAVEVLTGLKPGDKIVTQVTDDVADGAPVQIHEDKSSQAQPQAAPRQDTPPGGSTQYGDQGITDQNLQGKQAQQNSKGKGAGGKGTGAKQKSSGESKP